MSMPIISDINPDINIKKEDAINIIIASIAMEELALAHILNAEGEKLQYVLGTLKERDPGEVTLCDVMAVNKSIQKTLRDVIKEELLLQFKLEDVLEFDEGTNAECITTIITGRKIWKDSDNLDKTRPSTAKINLLQDGTVYRSVDVDSAGDGVYTFKYLPVYKSCGVEYTYTVDEASVPAGYTKTIDGFNVINTILPGLTKITGTKTWSDNNNTGTTRPTDITVNLIQNGKLITSSKVNSPPAGANTSTFSFDAPRFDSDGNLFVYTITEEPVDYYETTITGNDITNTLL